MNVVFTEKKSSKPFTWKNVMTLSIVTKKNEAGKLKEMFRVEYRPANEITTEIAYIPKADYWFYYAEE